MAYPKKSSEAGRLLLTYLFLFIIFLLLIVLLGMVSPFYKERFFKKPLSAEQPLAGNSEYLENDPHEVKDSEVPMEKTPTPVVKAKNQETPKTLAAVPKKPDAPVEKPHEQKRAIKPEKKELVAKAQPKSKQEGRSSKAVVEVSPRIAKKKIPLYLVLDDVGADLVKLKKFLALPIPITYAIIPFLAHSTESAKLVHQKGREVIIHQPMEPLHSENPGEGALFTWMSKDAIFKQLSLSIANVPYAVGMNNHMGSKATCDVGVMSAVLDYLGSSGLFFLDSKTTVDVVGGSLASRFNCPYVQRNAMFLDNERDRESLEKAIRNGLKTAQKNGHAVMIGHVMTSELADVLLEIYPEILDEGYAFYNLSHYFTDFDNGD